jgi:hypothetical protein
MGAFGHKIRVQLRAGRTALLASTVALTIAGSVALAAPASADSAEAAPLAMRPNSAAPRAGTETESPVSTSPDALAGPTASRGESIAGYDPDHLPLTRAAARRRIEDMSPVTWLSSFGAVTVGRPD